MIHRLVPSQYQIVDPWWHSGGLELLLLGGLGGELELELLELEGDGLELRELLELELLLLLLGGIGTQQVSVTWPGNSPGSGGLLGS